MKRSLEGTDILSDNVEISRKCLAIDVVVQMYPHIFPLVAQLAREFRKACFLNNWFHLYMQIHFDAANMYMYRLRLLNISLIRFGRGMMSYEEYRKYYTFFMENETHGTLGLEYFDRDRNFNYPKCLKPHLLNEYPRIFHWLSADESIPWIDNNRFHFDPIGESEWFQIEDSELIRMITKLPQMTIPMAFTVLSAIFAGNSIELIDILISNGCPISFGEERLISPNAIPRLLHYMDKIPDLAVICSRQPNFNVLFQSPHFSFEFAKKLSQSIPAEVFLSAYRGGLTALEFRELYPDPITIGNEGYSTTRCIPGIFYLGDDFFRTQAIPVISAKSDSILTQIFILLSDGFITITDLLKANPELTKLIVEKCSASFRRQMPSLVTLLENLGKLSKDQIAKLVNKMFYNVECPEYQIY